METRNIIVSAKVTAEEKNKIGAAASIACKKGEIPRSTPSTFIRTVSVAAAENVLTGGAKEDREKGKRIRELQKQLQEYKVKKEEAEKSAGEWQAKYNKERQDNNGLTSTCIDLINENSALKQQVQQLALENQQMRKKIKDYEMPGYLAIEAVLWHSTFRSMGLTR